MLIEILAQASIGANFKSHCLLVVRRNKATTNNNYNFALFVFYLAASDWSNCH